MCAILDANVASQVFGMDRSPAARAFFDQIDSGRVRLVVGGRLRRELDRISAFGDWRRQAVLAGRVILLNDEAVDDRRRSSGGRTPVARTTSMSSQSPSSAGRVCCTRTTATCRRTSATGP